MLGAQDYTDTEARLAISSSATGISYDNTTGVFTITSGYAMAATTSQSNWDTAYTERRQWDGGASNLTSATGRESLGLGGAAVLGVGTSAGTVSAGDHAHSGVYDPLGTATSGLAAHTSTYNHANYDTAYGWGDHTSAGYLIADGHTYENARWTWTIDGKNVTISDGILDAQQVETTYFWSKGYVYTDLMPATTTEYNLGSATHRWNAIYCYGLSISGTFGFGQVVSHITPFADALQSLGAYNKRWKDLRISNGIYNYSLTNGRIVHVGASGLLQDSSDLTKAGLIASMASATSAFGWGNHSSAGYLKANGMVDLSSGWTISTQSISLTAGTLTAAHLRDASLTAGRVVIAGTSGQLADDSGLLWDSANNRLGIGVTPLYPFHMYYGADATVQCVYENPNNHPSARMTVAVISNGTNYMQFGQESTSYGGRSFVNSNVGPLSFQVAGAEKARLTATGLFGVGITPLVRCHICSTADTDTEVLRLQVTASTSAATGAPSAVFFACCGDASTIAYNCGKIYSKFDATNYAGARMTLASPTGAGAWTDTINIKGGSVGIGATTTPTARLHLPAGTSTAGTAPLKFTTGTLLTAATSGAMEFVTDDLYFTIGTGTARKGVVLNDGANLTSGKIPIAYTNGRLIDGQTPLAGTKVYYVSDTSGGTVNRKLTFTNGILTAET